MNITSLGRQFVGPCVVIGSGPSVLGFPLDKLPSELKRIAVNFAFGLPTRIDYIIYTDKNFANAVEERDIPENAQVICCRSAASSWTDFVWTWRDIIQGLHSGFHAVQIAQLMGFDPIYLVGFDYQEIDGRLHFYDEELDEKTKSMFKHVLDNGSFVRDFDRCKWKSQIFNCSSASKLTKFPYRLPFEGGA